MKPGKMPGFFLLWIVSSRITSYASSSLQTYFNNKKNMGSLLLTFGSKKILINFIPFLLLFGCKKLDIRIAGTE